MKHQSVIFRIIGESIAFMLVGLMIAVCFIFDDADVIANMARFWGALWQ